MRELVDVVYHGAAVEVLADAEAAMGTKAIALKYSCSQSWVRRVKQEYSEQDKTAAKQDREDIREDRYRCRRMQGGVDPRQVGDARTDCSAGRRRPQPW
ncbi:hypothetical protein [Thalassoroseus pseudoceratinae]|uniref:hypothetical protein n=1 Tax=Thalassoroseus pseudoceratinae TaxID=2713176 RepID=UPI00142128F2|nr:hypothetical protein [Thalassoroseus pseudoceratinae]